MNIVSGYFSQNNFANWVSVTLVALVGVFLFRTFRRWYRLRHFKGPLIATLSRIWLARHVAGGRMHLDFQEVNQKYGSLARVGPNDLVTSDPAVMRQMLAVRSPYRRSEWYVGVRFDPVRDNIVSIRDEDRHTGLRAMMAAGYSGKENEDLEGTIDRNIHSQIKLIWNEYLYTNSEHKPMDLAEKEPFGYMATDSDMHGYINAVEQVFASALMVTIFPWLNWVLRLRVLKASFPSEKDPLGLGKILGLTLLISRGEQLTYFLMALRRRLWHGGLVRTRRDSEICLVLSSPTDSTRKKPSQRLSCRLWLVLTTAMAIRATLLYLVMHPRVTFKLRTEISNNPISSPIQDAEARKLPYLQTIIKEGLRIFPPVVGLMSRAVPPGGDVINNQFVPGGTKIGYGAYGIFRDKTTWVKMPTVFRPERWLEASPDKLKEMESTLELIFSYRNYQCLGKNLAMMELNKIFVELLRNFGFIVVNPMQPLRSTCGIFFQSQMWLIASERDRS